MGTVTNPQQSGVRTASTRRSGTERTRRPERRTEKSDRSRQVAREVLNQIFGPVSERTFTVRFWDGVTDAPANGSARFTLVLRAPSSLREMLLPPSELRICESFIRGDFDIEGEIEAATALGDPIRERVTSPFTVARIARLLLELPAAEPVARAHPERRDASSSHAGGRHTPERDAAAIRSHYDVGNDFYKLWLDDRMVYSCAYFEQPDADIHTAQLAKLDHLCRKLRLRPGQKLLDVGCGWGGLVLHAAQRYGVHATGVTLSYEQASLARERIQAAGLTDRCVVEVRDYRHLPLDESFDRIVSVGMVEHVGIDQLPTYFGHLYGLLRPGGLLMNHGIVHAPDHEKPSLLNRIGAKLWRDKAFIERYVFPDGELPPLAGVIAPAERAGFETRDVEILREHYMRTLRHWVTRLERSRDAAIAMVGEQTYRIWRLYMAGSAYGFASARLSLAQTLFAKADEHGQVQIPLTRADMYPASRLA